MKLKETKNIAMDTSRRSFLKKLGGGVIVLFAPGTALEGISRVASEDDFNAYLRVKPDGRVDCFSGKIEMGQGVITSLAQALAEELEVSLDKVDMVMGDTELCPYDAGTWGSRTTPYHDPQIRAAAATAREVFIEMASEIMHLPTSRLIVEDGIIYDQKDRNKKISYAALAEGKKIIRTVETPALKKAEDLRVVGKPLRRRDALEKITGKAIYAGDILLPGMLHARIKRPKTLNAKLMSVDSSAIDGIQDIKTIRDGDLFAVLHPSPDVAQRAVVKVKAIWEDTEGKTDDTKVFTYFKESEPEPKEFEQGGDLEEGRKIAEILVEEEYLDGYKAHASIETHTATAIFQDGKLTMWVSSQTPFGTRKEVSEAVDLPLEKVHIKQCFLGGGFGGKIYNQQAIEAAKIAIKSESPVQLMWSRMEEFMYDRFRPAAVVQFQSGLTRTGQITYWDFNILYAGNRGARMFYDVPHFRGRTYSKKGGHPLPTGAWRAPSNSTNTFGRETQIDIMAKRVNMDPLEFRLKNLTNPRVIRPLAAVAQKFGWKPNLKLPDGRGWGVALGEDVNVYVAMIGEVEVNKETGEVKVIRVVCCQDMGQVVNPQGSRLQIEGGITMGLGYALSEHIEFEGKEVKSSSFSDYEIARMSNTPEIETVFLDDMDAKPLGGGEPSIICVGAMVGNAIYNACGARIHQLPLTPERVLEGIKNRM